MNTFSTSVSTCRIPKPTLGGCQCVSYLFPKAILMVVPPSRILTFKDLIHFFPFLYFILYFGNKRSTSPFDSGLTKIPSIPWIFWGDHLCVQDRSEEKIVMFFFITMQTMRVNYYKCFGRFMIIYCSRK